MTAYVAASAAACVTGPLAAFLTGRVIVRRLDRLHATVIPWLFNISETVNPEHR
jgi:hypothetical protein